MRDLEYKLQLAEQLTENMSDRSALIKMGFIIENEVWRNNKFLHYTGYIPDPANPVDPIATIEYDGRVIVR